MRSNFRNSGFTRLPITIFVTLAVISVLIIWYSLTGIKSNTTQRELPQTVPILPLHQTATLSSDSISFSSSIQCKPCELCVLCEKCDHLTSLADSLLGNLSLITHLADTISSSSSSSISSIKDHTQESLATATTGSITPNCPPLPICKTNIEYTDNKKSKIEDTVKESFIEYPVTEWAKTLKKASIDSGSRTISFELMTAVLPEPSISFWFAVEETLHSATYIRDNEIENVKWWKSRIQEQKVRSGGPCLVVDVGSNGGYYSLLSRSMGCKVLAIDAQPRCLDRLASSVAVNGFKTGISTAWTAISTDESKTIQVGATKCSGLWAVKESAWIDAESSYNVDVKTRKLIDVLTEHKMLPEDNEGEPIAMLKVDVEGSEVNVFTTALPLFEKKQILGILAEVVPWRVNTITSIETVTDTFTRMYNAGYICAIGSASSTFTLEYVLNAFMTKSAIVGEHWMCYLK
jgi:FkbM family methyltransferase